MIKIIKYDFLKKYKLISVILITAVLLNLLLIIKFNVKGSGAFLGLFPLGMLLLYIVDIIKMYGDDLNKKSGYMLFMTPISGYKIIISKVTTAILELLFILILYFVFILINASYISIKQGYDVPIGDIFTAINIVLSGSLGFNLGHVFVILLAALILAISFILTVYTSITIRKSIFAEIKYGGILSFIIFIILNWILSYTSGKLMSVLSPYYDNIINAGTNITATQLVYILLPVIVLSAFESILLTLGSGYLLENKINL